MRGGILLGVSRQAFPSWLPQPKLLAEVSGVSWGIRIHGVSGSWVGGVRQGPMITDLLGWKLHHCPFGLCCLCPCSLSCWLGVHTVCSGCAAAAGQGPGREQAGMLRVSLHAPLLLLGRLLMWCEIPKGRSLFPRKIEIKEN